MDKQKRQTLKRLALGTGALAGSFVAPYVFARKKRTLRVLGTHVTLQDPIRQKAMADLGIDVTFAPGGSSAVLQRASMNPGSFDLYEQWTDSIGVLWRAGAIQPIEKNA